jgi:transposase
MTKRGRPITITIELPDDERQALRELARQAVGRVSERAHFVLSAAAGKPLAEIAEWMGYSVQTVYTWVKRYQDAGLAGLEDQPRSGRPPTERRLAGIVETQVSQSPRCSGYLAACWTVALLVMHLWQRFRVGVSVSTVRRTLARTNFTWGRPKLTLPRKRDPQATAKLARLKEALADPTGVVIAEDESEFHLLPVLRGMWHRRGQQPRVPTPGQNRKRPIFGGVNLRTGTWHYQLTDRKRGVEFIVFLASLLVAYPVGCIYVLTDNVSIHTSKAVQRWLLSQPRVELVFLPTYTGHQYNPAEKVWWRLKQVIAANRAFKDLREMDQFIRRYFATLIAVDTLHLINAPVTRLAQAIVAA